MKAYLLIVALLGFELAGTANAASLELEAKIPLGDVRGRIDHLAVDLGRERVFVAELGNNSVGVVDLRANRTILTLTGLKQPQGIGYVPSTDTLYIANAGDGSVRLFQGMELAPIGQLTLGDDADNIRVDATSQRVFVGYGDGALAVIDATMHRKVADIRLHAHPESFQFERSGERIFVNVPDRHEIASVDRTLNKQIASWQTGALRANFPLALDEAHQRVLVVFRHPATLGVFRMADGQLLANVGTCEDADDVFIDEKRKLIYVSCGEGFIDVLTSEGERYASTGRIVTVSGARTSLFIPALDRFVLAVRATPTTVAALWVFRPAL